MSGPGPLVYGAADDAHDPRKQIDLKENMMNRGRCSSLTSAAGLRGFKGSLTDNRDHRGGSTATAGEGRMDGGLVSISLVHH